MMINGFTDDCSIRKNFRAGDRTRELVTKNRLETVFFHIKNWMDTMHLNSDKTKYRFQPLKLDAA